MNKKLLLVGLFSSLALAGCGASAKAVSKKVNFKNIVSIDNERELLSNQVEEGFSFLKSLDIKITYTNYRYNSAETKEKRVDTEKQKAEFFSNGFICEGSGKTEINGSTFENFTFSNKTAVTDDTMYFVEVDNQSTSPYYSRDVFGSEPGKTKESYLISDRHDAALSVVDLYDLFHDYSDTSAMSYERSVVGRISDTKIGAYHEYKKNYAINEQGSDSATYTEVESGYEYMEAKLVGDVYQISKYEVKQQRVGNVYRATDRSRGSYGSDYIKLNKYEVLSEVKASIKFEYAKSMSDYAESSELKDVVANFPKWYVSGADLTVVVYRPTYDEETNEITGVSRVASQTLYPLSYSDDMHSFSCALTNADPNYLYQFEIWVKVTFYDEEGDYTNYYFSDIVDPANGASYVKVVEEENYYKGESGKLYNFSVKVAFDAEAEEGEEVSVAEFKLA